MTEPAPEPAPGATRLRSLDGLRGIAALIVVFHHCLLASSTLGDGTTVPAVGSLQWLFTSTPLKVFSAGTEAVTIFFVLSGLVLVVPVLARPAYDWVEYYPRRIVRLYVPVIGSVLLAAVLIAIHPQTNGSHISNWLGAYSMNQLRWRDVLQSVDIFGSNVLNNPLWTIKWEIIFSLALPLFVLLALKTARWALVGVAVSFVLVAIGNLGQDATLQYLPVFYVGALIAVHHRRLQQWSARHAAGWPTHLIGSAALLLGVLLLVLPWWAGGLLPSMSGVGELARAASLPGAAIIVIVAFLWRPAVWFLTVAPIRWLGRVSFSLYLVHVPILIAVANLLGPGHWLETVAITIVASMAVAELFTRFVEQPAHRWSKVVGRRSSLLLAKRPEQAVPRG